MVGRMLLEKYYNEFVKPIMEPMKKYLVTKDMTGTVEIWNPEDNPKIDNGSGVFIREDFRRKHTSKELPFSWFGNVLDPGERMEVDVDTRESSIVITWKPKLKTGWYLTQVGSEKLYVARYWYRGKFHNENGKHVEEPIQIIPHPITLIEVPKWAKP